MAQLLWLSSKMTSQEGFYRETHGAHYSLNNENLSMLASDSLTDSTAGYSSSWFVTVILF